MKNMKEKEKLSTLICKKLLSKSLVKLSNDTDDECILILYEPKQPENLKNVDLKLLRKNIG
jgi:cyclic lactone autoinducer peptide